MTASSMAGVKPPLVLSAEAPLPDLKTVVWENYSHLRFDGARMTPEMEPFYHAALAHNKSVHSGSPEMQHILANRSE